MAKTICVDCKHHNGANPSDAWHTHLCLNPLVQRHEEQDPVTGLIGFGIKNSLGKICIISEKYPNCSDYNHGNCDMFEPKI
jgi:hypothetical protein